MFEDPKDAHRFYEDGRYRLQLVRFEPLEPGQYGERVRWVMHTWNLATKEQQKDERGFPREFWGMTSTKMGSKATARKWMEAFLGRAISEEESGKALAQEAIGKYADALIGGNDGGYDAILQIYPVKQTATTTNPDPNPSAMPEEPPDTVIAQMPEPAAEEAEAVGAGPFA